VRHPGEVGPSAGQHAGVSARFDQFQLVPGDLRAIIPGPDRLSRPLQAGVAAVRRSRPSGLSGWADPRRRSERRRV